MNSSPQRTDRPHSWHDRFVTTLPQTLIMVLLFATAAVFEAKNPSSLTSLANSDIWLHLRTGIWILQNHVVPHSALFSQSPESPWAAASWGYDLKVAFAFRVLGLRSIPLLLMGFKTALAIFGFLLAGGLRGRLWPAVVLSATAQYILADVQPGPGYCSLLFFAVELLLLNDSRANGVRVLFWLPPLFLLWANFDIQFVYGILVLLLFFTTAVLQKRYAVSLKNAGIVTLLCGLATCVTPYSYHPYGVFFATITSAANRYVPDLHALGFRRPQDYVLMLLTMAAFLALGRRRSRDPFQIVLLIGCTMLSFHAQRDAWLAALASLAVIGDAIRNDTIRDTEAVTHSDSKPARSPQISVAIGLSLVIMVLAVALVIPRSNDALMAKVAQTYPVAACNYIRERHLPQPLFNSYEWGGFLAWYLPEYPVAIDSGAGLYDDDFVIQYFKVMNAEVPFQSYPTMSQAATVLLPRHSVMGEVLSTLPAYRVSYSDNVAVVLSRQ